jgi:hypothetical protein
MNEEFLPDGGFALANGRIKLPYKILITENVLIGQIIKEVVPGRTLIQCEVYGHMFAFLVALTPNKVRAHIEQYAVLGLTNFKPGHAQTSAITGERFRDVLCDPVLMNRSN